MLHILPKGDNKTGELGVVATRALWLDLLNPTSAEVTNVEETVGATLPSLGHSARSRRPAASETPVAAAHQTRRRIQALTRVRGVAADPASEDAEPRSGMFIRALETQGLSRPRVEPEIERCQPSRGRGRLSWAETRSTRVAQGTAGIGRILFSNGSRARGSSGCRRVGMPAFSARSFGA
jgi:hypothetical protein